MRLVQDMLLVACLLFAFNSANAANMMHPLQQLWTHIQSSLDNVISHPGI